MTAANLTENAPLLWQPTPDDIEQANLTAYMRWLARQKDLHFSTYPELWTWSTTHIEDFWESLFDYFDLTYSERWTTPLVERVMPGAQWFPGARLNYAENIFARRTDGRPMMFYKAEDRPLIELSWQQIEVQVSRLAQVLRGLGVGRGDRVVGYLPNIPEAIVALLATVSLGAIWSSCSPDFGSQSVLDRFTQIEPKVLIAVDGYRYGGKVFDRRDILAELQTALPTVAHTLLVPQLSRETAGLRDVALWDEALASVTPPDTLTFEQVPFDHPLWVLYSSGTTGLPKPIVQGHGGILLEHIKEVHFQNNVKAGDRYFWYTSTGWMMWNYLIGTLLSGATIVVYDGSPGYPDMNALFELAGAAGVTYFGTSAAFISACIKADIHPSQHYDLSHIRTVGATGSPLTPEGFQWVYDNLHPKIALESFSGGTDICTPVVGGVPIQPIYRGEIQGASLGSKIEAYNDACEPVVGEVGELMITAPMPSMPLFFWNDPGMARYRDSYFDVCPGVWRHGDWIRFNERGGCVIYGRSDSTINRKGVRLGTSEIYRAVEAFPEVADSLIVDLELLGRESYMPLFVVLRGGATLDDDLKKRIQTKIRNDVSPRHIPDDILQIEQVPYTLSGKKMEIPVRKILLGMDAAETANRGAMRNPETLDFFIDFARTLRR